METSVKEVLEKAKCNAKSIVKNEALSKPDAFEIQNQPNATIRLQRVKIQDLEDRLRTLQETFKGKIIKTF